MYGTVAYARDRLKLSLVTAAALTAAAVALFAAWPSVDAVSHDIREARPSTRMLAREWIIENVEPGSRLAGEGYTAPMDGVDVVYSHSFSLFGRTSAAGHAESGVRYIVASSYIYDRYYAEPARYDWLVERYDALFEENVPLKEFRPSNTRGGPVIRIYEIGTDGPDAVTDTEDRSR